MTMTSLEEVARAIVADGKGIHHRARCDSAASLGGYHSVMENDPAFG